MINRNLRHEDDLKSKSALSKKSVLDLYRSRLEKFFKNFLVHFGLRKISSPEGRTFAANLPPK